MDEHSKLARVALDIPTEADEAFRTNVAKMSVRLPDSLRPQLRVLVAGVVSRAQDVYRQRVRLVSRPKPAPSGNGPDSAAFLMGDHWPVIVDVLEREMAEHPDLLDRVLLALINARRTGSPQLGASQDQFAVGYANVLARATQMSAGARHPLPARRRGSIDAQTVQGPTRDGDRMFWDGLAVLSPAHWPSPRREDRARSLGSAGRRNIEQCQTTFRHRRAAKCRVFSPMPRPVAGAVSKSGSIAESHRRWRTCRRTLRR